MNRSTATLSFFLNVFVGGWTESTSESSESSVILRLVWLLLFLGHFLTPDVGGGVAGDASIGWSALGGGGGSGEPRAMSRRIELIRVCDSPLSTNMPWALACSTANKTLARFSSL